MTAVYTFPCGCSFPILKESSDPEVMPLLDFSIDNIPDDCPAVWNMLASGATKGIFQLESSLGRTWSQKLKPVTAEHLSALGAILRPGTLRSYDENGVSLTEHYAKRKNGEEPLEEIHPAIDPILSKTFFIVAYQEQSMLLCQNVAGFNLQQADILRRAIGKKIPEEMAKVHRMFMEGVAKVGVIDAQMAEKVWGWIEESQRYSFNHCLDGKCGIMRPPGIVSEEYSVGNLYKSLCKFGAVGKAFSLREDGSVFENTIKDIRPMGIRPTLLITTELDAAIKVTPNHKFPTVDGEMTAAEIAAVLALGLEVKLYEFYPEEDGMVVASCVVSVEEAGESEVYDVEMEAPYHNFVTGDNIVTCNSHSMAYGLTGYDTAYLKVHFPVQFFTSWLATAKSQAEPDLERFELVQEAKRFDVIVEPPDLRIFSDRASTDGKKVFLGLTDIKGVGHSSYVKLKKALAKPVAEMTWEEFLFMVGVDMPCLLMERLIEVGACRWTGKSRKRLLAEYRAAATLKEIELAWVRERLAEFRSVAEALMAVSMPRQQKPVTRRWREVRPGLEEKVSLLEEQYGILRDNLDKQGLPDMEIANLEAAIKKNRAAYNKSTIVCKETVQPPGPFGGCSNENREKIVRGYAQLLETPAESQEDTPFSIACAEEKYLGVALTYSRIDSCDISEVNTSCADFLAEKKGFLVMGVEISDVREFKVKKGKNAGKTMAYLTVSDSSGLLADVTVFSDVWEQVKHILVKGNTVGLQGDRDFKKGQSFIVKRAWLLG